MAKVHLIGVRGIPNRYGGFERLVEVLAPDLMRRGHDVTVYCESDSDSAHADVWHGVRRQFLPVASSGAGGTLLYDWKSFAAVPRDAVALIFGYGTAVFQLRLKLRGVRHAVNMDGIEWQRAKWGTAAKLWLRFNERAATWLSDELVADHPEIQRYLRESLKVDSTMIAYGVDLKRADPGKITHPLLHTYAGKPYLLVIARPEPENQIHLLLEAHKRVDSVPLLVVGNFLANSYGRDLIQRYPGATFVGPIYDAPILDALRSGALLYLHGHSVGGTNPSLIEAMAAGALVAAHDNPFNRWVLSDEGGLFFRDLDQLVDILSQSPSFEIRSAKLKAAGAICRERFMWSHILDEYGRLVERLTRT